MLVHRGIPVAAPRHRPATSRCLSLATFIVAELVCERIASLTPTFVTCSAVNYNGAGGIFGVEEGCAERRPSYEAV
jgi:hypothetical protein